MPVTIPIPLTTLTVGVHTFGPTVVPVGTTQCALDIDRTAGTASLNSSPPTTTLDLRCDASPDGGATWQMMFSAHAIGGTYIDDETGLTITHSTVFQAVPTSASGKQVRALLTVGSAAVSVSGTLTLS